MPGLAPALDDVDDLVHGEVRGVVGLDGEA
jgi:hypothetical protein